MGRPRKHPDNAAKQRAYRARKKKVVRPESREESDWPALRERVLSNEATAREHNDLSRFKGPDPK